MNKSGKMQVAVNDYGVVVKRVAAAVAIQDDMKVVEIADIGADWRMRVASRRAGTRMKVPA